MNKYKYFFIFFIILIIIIYVVFLINKYIKILKLKNTFTEIETQIWLNKPSKIIFPELYPNNFGSKRLFSPEGVSLAFEAGGRRAYSGFIGILRGLNKIRINNLDAFECSQFVSTVSASSWLLGTYLFANKTISRNLLLGSYIPPENISMETLNNVNFGLKNNYFLGNRLVSADIKKYIDEGYANGIQPEYLWNYGISEIFLKPYGLNNKIISIKDTYADYIYKITGLKPITPNEDLPFWISNCALLHIQNNKMLGTAIFQVTPIYAGLPNLICNKYSPFGFNNTNIDACVGGFFQNTYSVGSINPNLFSSYNNKHAKDWESINVKVKIPFYQNNYFGNNLFTLESVIGTSGSSQASKFNYNANNVIPSFNLWSPKSNSTDFVPIGDGAYCDFTGITSLLSRNVKHIISFITCSNNIKENANPKIHSDFCGLNILNLFGLNKTNLCNQNDPNFNESNNNQVFQKEDWLIFAKKLIDSIATGGPGFSRNKFNVLPNYLLGIQGGYEVDLLVVVINTSSQFNKLLPKSISDTFSNLSGPFPNFPNYPLINSNLNLLISLSKAQINLLDSYIEWCILYPTLKNTILQMYLEAGVNF